MKKIYCFLLFAACHQILIAQNVGIGTISPHASAQLDITSTGKGLLPPRMTLAQRGTILSPATGLLVYQTDNTPGFYYYNGASWILLSTGSATNFWTLNGTDIYKNNSGNVGIGITTPLARLHVEGNALISNGGPLRLRDDAVSNTSTIYFDLNNGTQQFQVQHLPGLLSIQKIPATTYDWAMTSAGLIGIGTASPAVKVHIYGSSGEVLRLDAATDPQLGLTQSGVLKGVLRLGGDDIVLGSPASNDLGKLIVRLNGGDRMIVHPDGKVSIGTTTPATGYLLSVKGKVISEEVRVELNVNWPDYVFQPGYKIHSLQWLEEFIQKNKHLPGIPSAAQVQKEGIELGDMNKRLLEKIEELTLYMINQDKELERLKQKMALIETNQTKK